MTKPKHHTWSMFTLKDGLERRYKAPRQNPEPPWITEPYKDNKLLDPSIPPWTRHKSYTPKQDTTHEQSADVQKAEVPKQLSTNQSPPKPPPPVRPPARAVYVEPTGNLLPPPGSVPRPNGKGFMRVPTPPKRAGCNLLVMTCWLFHGTKVSTLPSGAWRPTTIEDGIPCLKSMSIYPALAELKMTSIPCVTSKPGGYPCIIVIGYPCHSNTVDPLSRWSNAQKLSACLDWFASDPLDGRNPTYQSFSRGGMHLTGIHTVEYRRALARETNTVLHTPSSTTPLHVCLLDGTFHHYNLARLEAVEWFDAEEDPPSPQSDYAGIPRDHTPGGLRAVEELREALASPLNRCVIDGSRQYYNIPRIETVD
eukprot:3774965-Amphidinium_carterae.1